MRQSPTLGRLATEVLITTATKADGVQPVSRVPDVEDGEIIHPVLSCFPSRTLLIECQRISQLLEFRLQTGPKASDLSKPKFAHTQRDRQKEPANASLQYNVLLQC